MLEYCVIESDESPLIQTEYCCLTWQDAKQKAACEHVCVRMWVFFSVWSCVVIKCACVENEENQADGRIQLSCEYKTISIDTLGS